MSEIVCNKVIHINIIKLSTYIPFDLETAQTIYMYQIMAVLNCPLVFSGFRHIAVEYSPTYTCAWCMHNSQLNHLIILSKGTSIYLEGGGGWMGGYGFFFFRKCFSVSKFVGK